MKFVLRKHIPTGIGADLFLQREIELTMVPIVGMSVTWKFSGHVNVEKVDDVVVDLDLDTCYLWVDKDGEVLGSENRQEKLDRLSAKVRDYQNRGWLVQK